MPLLINCVIKDVSSPLNSLDYGIIVIGGGTIRSVMTSLLSKGLSKIGSDVTIAFFDGHHPKPKEGGETNDSAAIAAAAKPSIRTYALSPASLGIIYEGTFANNDNNPDKNDELSSPFSSITTPLFTSKIGTYKQIQVLESTGPSLIKFDEPEICNL